jgi:hypothetical protein
MLGTFVLQVGWETADEDDNERRCVWEEKKKNVSLMFLCLGLEGPVSLTDRNRELDMLREY